MDSLEIPDYLYSAYLRWAISQLEDYLDEKGVEHSRAGTAPPGTRSGMFTIIDVPKRLYEEVVREGVEEIIDKLHLTWQSTSRHDEDERYTERAIISLPYGAVPRGTLEEVYLRTMYDSNHVSQHYVDAVAQGVRWMEPRSIKKDGLPQGAQAGDAFMNEDDNYGYVFEKGRWLQFTA